ncbi:MAG: hypothetical protein MJ210_05505 [Alphaproteobacteria bacterium]|nr:hypothetical protein [Alphaproteobacteria bacterium]
MNNKNNKQEKKNAKNNRKNFSYKHVSVNKVRPKLTKGNFDQKKSSSKKLQKGSVQKDKNAKLRVIPLGGLDGIGDNMTVFYF